MPTLSTMLRALDRARSRRSLRGEQGFMLIEVIISALLVAIVVVATFNGFDTANRLTIDQRRHAQAALLAAESQEQLRTDSATALDALETSPRTFERTLGGTKYKITQQASPLNGSGASSACSAGESSSERGANIQITSSVTWAALERAKRPAVKQSSIISPPVGSSLEVDVTGGGSPPKGIPGVTAVARFTPVGSGTQATAEGTTGSAGCVVLTGLASTKAIVEILEKTNYVTTSGDLKVPTKEISIAPNITTPYAVTYDEGGLITAEYTWEGKTFGPLGAGQPVTGSTFVVTNESIPSKPKYQTGGVPASMKFQTVNGEPNYELEPNAYAGTGSTAKHAGFEHGDLFPFAEAWTVYAGDCPKNRVGKEYAEAKVTPGGESVVKVPMSYVKLLVQTGTFAAPGTVDTVPLEATTTTTECEGYELPNNAVANITRHQQLTNTSGALSAPFQPFGKETLCVYNPTKERTYTSTFVNSTAAGNSRTVYLEERSKAEREAEENAIEAKRAKELTELETARGKREAEESAAKALKAKREVEEAEAKKAKEKREKEEVEAATKKATREKAETEALTAKAAREKLESEAKAAKEKREKEEAEMAAAKKTREEKELKERETWKSEELKGKITKKQREEKEAAQKKAREKIEAEEKAAKEKRTKEETEAKTAREKREKEETEALAAKKTRETEETAALTAKKTREAEEAAALAAKSKRESEEAEAKTAREKREQEEAEAAPLRIKREEEEAAAKPVETKLKEEKEKAAAQKTQHEKEEKETEEKTGITVASGKKSC